MSAVGERSDVSGKAPSLTLLEQARGLSRNRAMEEVVGPAIAEFLHPIYNLSLTEFETRGISPVGNFDGGRVLVDEAQAILFDRLAYRTEGERLKFEEIDELVRNRRDLFYKANGISMLQEGIQSGLVMSWNIGAHIFRLESEVPYGAMWACAFAHERLAEIIRGDVCDETLREHLTKGPINFLADASLLHSFGFSSNFLQFTNPNGEGDLPIHEAYRMEEGRVLGLSGAYHVSADRRRRELISRPRYSEYRGDLSSGCPVRHNFTGADGELMSTITDSRFFLAAVIEASKI